MVIKVQKLSHKDNREVAPFVYRPDAGINLPSIPADVSVFDMLFIKNKHKIESSRVIYIDAETEEVMTYGQLKHDILSIATGLRKQLGLQFGDVVAICCPNHIQFPSLFHGVVCAGGIIAAIPHSISNFRVQNIIDDLETIRPKVVVLYQGFLEQVLPHLAPLGIPDSHVLVIDKHPNLQSVRDLIIMSTEKDLMEPFQYTEKQLTKYPSYLFFTSGSTGKRKAVMVSQYAMVSCMINRPVNPGSDPVRILGCNKFFHSSSLILALHLAVYKGDQVYIQKKFQLEDICQAIERHRIHSMMALFYNISEMCCKDSVAHRYDLSSLTLVYNIGSKLYHSAIDMLKKKYGFSIIDTYGLTETLIMFQNSVENTKKGSSGRLLGGYEARLINAKGEDVGPGETGQLCVKGPTVCLGYFNDPSATAALIGPEEGYIYTGDLLRCDERGLFYYVDRYKDMIRYYESSIFPSSIEYVLLKHPKVLECAVVGLKIPSKNIEVPRAYVRLATCDMEQYEAVKQDITQFVDNSLPDEMRLRGGLFIIESFPRTYSGKIQRYTLKVEANKNEKITLSFNASK